MKILLFIQAFIFAMLANAEQVKSNAASIHKEFKFEKKLNNATQTLILTINGESIASPFIWSVEVFYNGTQAYKVERNDEWLNKFFSDSGYIENCNGYNACKEKWYFSRLPEMVGESIYIAESNSSAVEPWELESLESEAKENLKQKGIGEEKAKEIIYKMQGQLRNGRFLILSLPFSPVQMDSAKMYTSSINQFVSYASN
jgi:hypothetical protein